MKQELIPITKLVNNKGQIEGLPKNPRFCKDHKFVQLKQSIKDDPEMLELREVIAVDYNGELVVIAGNMRLNACLELGIKEVPCKILPQNTPVEKLKAITIKDNIGYGEHDWDALANQWDVEELAHWGLDLPLDFEADETELEAEEDNYEVPEQIETDIVLGDLFEIGEHRLLCGDSTDSDAVARLMNGEKADMVFTSPPYNANTKAGQGDIFNKKKSIKLYSDGYSDNLDSSEYVKFAKSVLNNCFLFTNGHIFWNVSYNANSRFEYIQQLENHLEFLIEQICWKKSSTIPFKGSLMRDWEPIYVFSTNGKMLGLNSVHSNHWEVNNTNSQQDNHKACFPVELPSKAIKLNNLYKIIFEPFCGSGSTMVASHQLKRKCYGIELDVKYCQVIIDRMRKLDPTIKIKKNGQPYEQSI